MRLDLRINSSKMFDWLIYWVWAQTILVTYVRAVVMRVPYLGAYPDVVMTILFLIIMLSAIPAMQLTAQDFLFVFSCYSVYFLSWILFKAQRNYIEEKAAFFLLKVLPLYLVGASLGRNSERERIIHNLYKISMITIPVTILYKMKFSTPMSAVASQYEGNMEYAYDLLPHLCLIAFYAVKKTNIWNLTTSIIGGVYLMLQGTRGAVLLDLLMIAVLIIMGRKSKGAIVRVIVVFGVVVAFFMSPLYNAFILFMYQKAQKVGLSIRVFDKLLSGSIGQSSGRDLIREALLAAIGENPILGYGIFGDRVIAGNYAHNIAIELWVEFGVVVGSILLIMLFYTMFKGYRSANFENGKALITALICAEFGCLQLSSSYLDSRLLFFLVGICVGVDRKRVNLIDKDNSKGV